MDKNSLDDLASELMSQMDVATATEIVAPDDRETHILDNGAGLVIADSPPMYPDEMPDVDEGQTPGQVGGSNDADEVLGRVDYVRGGGRRVREVFRDDFAEAVRQQAKAARGPNGEMLDEFDQKFQIQRQEHQALQDQANFVRIVPPTSLQGILGGQATVSSGGPLQSVAYWAGKDSETIPITVTLAPVQVVGLAGTQFGGYRPFARIVFGSRGFSTTVDVDIGQGCQFTLSCSSISVSVGMDPTGSTTNANPGTMILSGMLSFYAIAKANAATRTIYYDGAVNNGATINFNIPQFAKSWSVYGNAQHDSIAVTDNSGNFTYQIAALPATTTIATIFPVTPLFGSASQMYWKMAAGNIAGAMVFFLSF